MNSRRVVVGPTSISDPRPDQRLTPIDRVVLAQRMTDELLVHEQPTQVRVALEADTEHVPDLALEPDGDRPEDNAGPRPAGALPDAPLSPPPPTPPHPIPPVAPP